MSNRPRLPKEYGRNKRMNDSVYKERRQVMDVVYEAKRMLRNEGISLPRINVRIVEQCGCSERKKNVLGVGGNLNIFIMERALTRPYFREVVLHEIVHAVTGFGHDEKCPLMHPSKLGANKAEIDKAFISYFK